MKRLALHSRPVSIKERLSSELILARQEIREGRFQRSMSVIAAFAAIVSGYEAYSQHLRGAFRHWLMWTPVWLTLPTVFAAAWAIFNRRVARFFLPMVSLVSLLDGVVGFVFHLRGIQRLPGGFKIGQYNVVMGPPVFAPLLLCMVGISGIFAGFLRREQLHKKRWTLESIGNIVSNMPFSPAPLKGVHQIEARIAQGRFRRWMAITAGIFAVLSGGEAYFEHLRGSFNRRVMWAPVWVTPLMVAATASTIARKQIADAALLIASPITFLVGFVGFFLHLRGIKHMPGGFSNFQFNATLGPPLFAPLLFSAVGLLGLIAAFLRQKRN